MSRRALLVLSAALLAAGFTVWTLYPSYLGFASGFVLWGASGALRSGTFEALIYDDLHARAATAEYAKLTGYTRSASESAALAGILAAAPLYAWGGFALVAWSSVAMAALHTLSALLLPSAPKSVSAGDIEDLEDIIADGSPESCAEDTTPDPPGAAAAVVGSPEVLTPERNSPSYFAMLRSGLREGLRVRVIRRGVILVALLNGITAFDEYFALLAGHAGARPSYAAVLVALTVAGSLAGSALAGRTESIRPHTMSAALAAAGLLFISGSLLAGAAAHHPSAMYSLTAVGFSAVGVAYGIDYNADVIASARLQDAITGPARATVTSVAGFATEVVALAVFVFAAAATTLLPLPSVIALLGLPLLLAAALTPTWLPHNRAEPVGSPQSP